MAISIPSYETVASWVRGLGPKMKRLLAFFSGPEIGAKLLNSVDDDFYLEVKNTGGGVAIPRVFLTNLADSRGKFTGLVTSPIEIYERDTLEPATRLFGDARSIFAIMSVDWRDPAGPMLRINTVIKAKGVRSKSLVHITPAAPLEGQSELRLTYRVVFYSPDEPQQELMDLQREYLVRPVPTAEQRYTMTLIKRPHRSRTAAP